MTPRTVQFNGQSLTIQIRDEADESVAAEIFKLREYRITEELIKNAVDPILDIGAHSGLFTLYARTLNPIISIVAVEPEEGNIALLKQHLADNQITNVKIIEGAIAGTSGRRQLILSQDSHNHRLSDGEKDSKITTTTIRAYSLNDLLNSLNISRVGLIKMDIEGGEYEVFERLKTEDYKKIKAVIMEYHEIDGRRYSEIELLLRENGFGVQIFPSKFDKTMGFLFATNKR